MKNIFRICILLILTGNFLFAQDGTVISAKQIAFENSFVPTITTLQSANRTIHITVHIVAEDGIGTKGIAESVISQTISDIDTAFKDIDLHFKIREFNVVPNYNFNDLSYLVNEKSLIAEYNVANTLNLYVVNSLVSPGNSNVTSYTYMPGDSTDCMFVTKTSCNFNTLIVQFGHFFSLYNTHEIAVGGLELADSSNCTTSGDRCCDTPADPDLTGKVNAACNYTGVVSINERDYVPETKNYMSNTRDACKCFFSDDQLIRVLNCLESSKKHLL